MRWRLLQVERQWEDCCKSLLWLVFICVRVAGMWCCNLVHDFYSCTLSIDGRYPSSINCKKCFPMCFLMPKCISKLDVVLYALYRLCVLCTFFQLFDAFSFRHCKHLCCIALRFPNKYLSRIVLHCRRVALELIHSCCLCNTVAMLLARRQLSKMLLMYGGSG